MLDMTALQAKIDAVADVIGISIGKYDDKSTWNVLYKGTPTKTQLSLVATIIQEQKVLTDEEDAANRHASGYLQSTDWIVLRHLEEVAMGDDTTLSHNDFKALSVKRDTARTAIVKG